MHSAAASAVSVLLFGLTGLFVLYAAASWAKLAKDREPSDQRPAIPVAAFRSAAGVTAAALVLAGVSLVWAALLALP
jgi:hypothetical protein